MLSIKVFLKLLCTVECVGILWPFVFFHLPETAGFCETQVSRYCEISNRIFKREEYVIEEMILFIHGYVTH